MSCISVWLHSVVLHLNSLVVVTNATTRCGSFLYYTCFPSGAPQSVFPVISYNILLFRGTPQQLEELFVAVLDE